MIKRNSKSGRPSGGDGANKTRILDAARAQFADRGYHSTTMRDIAAAAGIDVALIAHYFGNKDKLFASTVALPPGFMDVMFAELSDDPADQSARLTRAYLTLWEAEETAEHMRLLARNAVGNEIAGQVMRDFISHLMADPRVTVHFQNRLTGFALAMTHLFGTAVARYVVRMDVLAKLDFEDLVRRIEPVVHQHLLVEDHQLPA